MSAGVDVDLARYIDDRTRVPFAWGTNDCAGLAADWVKARAGVDPLQDFCAYDTKVGAAQSLAQAGFRNLREAVEACAALVRTQPAFAQVGDIVQEAGRANAALGICCGRNAAFLSEAGVRYQRTVECAVAWTFKERA